MILTPALSRAQRAKDKNEVSHAENTINYQVLVKK